MKAVRQHLTTTVPVARWYLYLMLLALIVDDIADEHWTGLAVLVASFLLATLYYAIRAKRQAA
jgi:hypothetical protein